MRTCASIIPHLSILTLLFGHHTLDVINVRSDFSTRHIRGYANYTEIWTNIAKCYRDSQLSGGVVIQCSWFRMRIIFYEHEHSSFSKVHISCEKEKIYMIFFQNLQKQACQSDKCKLFTCREISQILLFYLAIRELIAKSTASSFTVVVICKIHHPM